MQPGTTSAPRLIPGSSGIPVDPGYFGSGRDAVLKDNRLRRVGLDKVGIGAHLIEQVRRDPDVFQFQRVTNADNARIWNPLWVGPEGGSQRHIHGFRASLK